jgi:hypothetical protein
MKAIMDTDRQAKPAYFAYRDALTPLAVNLQPDKFYGFSGDELRVHAWVLNDTQEIPPGATLRYQVELAGEVIQTGRAPATIQACEPVFQGAFIVALPTVSTRQPVTVRLGLFDKANTLIHDTVVDLDVFPASEKGQKIDRPGGAAQRLLQ